MKILSLMLLLGLAIAISISASSIIFPWTFAQTQNKTSPGNSNDTRQIINLKDNTITLVNKTTNETISTTPYPAKTGNTTTNETNKMIVAGKTGNTSMNVNLSERLSKLAK